MKLRIFGVGVGVGIESTNKYLLMLVFVVLNSDPDTDSDPDPDRLRDSPAAKSIHLRYGASPYKAPAGTAQKR